MTKSKETVVVGISGGVDSSVAAYLLKQQGYEVVGLFMQNWQSEPGEVCTSEIDFEDASQVCDLLDICLLYTSPSPRDRIASRMPSSA